MVATLQSMPVELLDRIVDHLAHEEFPEQRHCVRFGLQSLRLTCREILNKSTNYFAREHFRRVTVKSGMLGFERVSQILEKQLYRDSIRELCLKSEATGYQPGGCILSSAGFARNIKFFMANVKMLSRLDFEFRMGPNRNGTRLNMPNDFARHDWHYVIVETIRALLANGLQLKHLSHNYTSFYWGTDSLPVGELLSVDGSSQVIDYLETITLQGLLFDHYGRHPNLTYSLSALQIDGKVTDSSRKFYRLKSVKLDNLAFGHLELQKLFIRFPSTLQRIELVYIVLSSGTWAPVFEELATRFQLRSVQFKVLQMQNNGYGGYLSFAAINEHRPMIRDEVEGDYVMVYRDYRDKTMALSEDEGDLVSAWLLMIARKYTVES